MEENFRKIVTEAFRTDIKEIADGPIKKMTEILSEVYKMGVMRGMELQSKLCMAKHTNQNPQHYGKEN